MPPRRRDYMPRADGDFNSWVQNFFVKVTDFYSNQGIDPGPLVALDDARIEWEKAVTANLAAQALAESTAQRKRTARSVLDAVARPIVAFVQTYPATTNADRAMMAITPKLAGGTPVPTPATRPVARLESGQRLRHELRIVDEATPTRKAKPAGVLGVEVWRALTAPYEPSPGPGDAYRFLGLNTRGVLTTFFDTGDAGKTAHYCMRWTSTRGEKGPWSEVISATVAA